jgi:hypothetical protein
MEKECSQEDLHCSRKKSEPHDHQIRKSFIQIEILEQIMGPGQAGFEVVIKKGRNSFETALRLRPTTKRHVQAEMANHKDILVHLIRR